MAENMDWTPDFCLACDRQTSGGAYCSQTCRLADIERASGGSEPVSPSSSGPSPSWKSSNGRFQLPPPLNFGTCKPTGKAQSPSLGSSPLTSYAPNCYFSHPFNGSQSTISSSGTTSTNRALTPSSSRSSLSSIRSSSVQDNAYLSDQARNELRSYASSFDQIRDLKRRMSTV
ncbi:MAG: hypothetical protein M1819_002026 [Sarea resinae]|nr:MAG: hypothetical protein M1819_002026 [Sarea resinae]